MKLLEENIGERLFDISLGIDFLDDTKSKSNKNKWDSSNWKSAAQHSEKASCGMREDICKSCNWPGVNIQNT